MKLVKVAVITRTKNRPILLKRAIESVLNQTYQDWLLVIVNDGGNRLEVENLLSQFKNHILFKQIKLINNKISQGMEKASNIGIKNSESKYIVIHDDDDSWHSDFLKETVSLLEEQTVESSFHGVITHVNEISEELIGNQIQIIKKIIFPLHHNFNSVSFVDMFRVNQFLPIAFLYRRDVIEKIGFYDEHLPVVGDWEFNLRFMRFYDIAVIEKPLANYHLRFDLTGEYANSLIEKKRLHKKYDVLVRNRFLREDIKNNTIGLGFLLNSGGDNSLNTVSLLEDKITAIYNSKSYRLGNLFLNPLKVVTSLFSKNKKQK